jgi:hypothetical protein
MLNRLSDNVTDVPGINHVLKNNLGYKGGAELKNAEIPKCVLINNSFEMNVTLSDADFITLDESVLTAPRKADGSLPDTGFMKVKPNSKSFVVLKGMGY